MEDVLLSELLSSRGLEGQSAETALLELYRRGLTRPGKTRIAEKKAGAVDEALAHGFRRRCGRQECSGGADDRVEIRVAPTHCDVCGGSDNRRAVDRMVAGMRNAGITRLLVAGGSPGTRGDLERLCGGRIELRFVTGESSVRRRDAAALVRWCDVALIWASTEIPHKATAAIRGAKVLTVDRRGVAALALAVRDWCGGRDAASRRHEP